MKGWISYTSFILQQNCVYFPLNPICTMILCNRQYVLPLFSSCNRKLMKASRFVELLDCLFSSRSITTYFLTVPRASLVILAICLSVTPLLCSSLTLSNWCCLATHIFAVEIFGVLTAGKNGNKYFHSNKLSGLLIGYM